MEQCRAHVFTQKYPISATFCFLQKPLMTVTLMTVDAALVHNLHEKYQIHVPVRIERFLPCFDLLFTVRHFERRFRNTCNLEGRMQHRVGQNHKTDETTAFQQICQSQFYFFSEIPMTWKNQTVPLHPLQ